MMWNVTCLCKKLQIWDLGFCHCWISLRNIVKDCKRPKLNIVGLGRSLHFGVTFLFLQLEALFLSLKLSDLMPTVLMHGSAGKVSTTIEGKQRIWWYEKNKIKARTEGKERGKKSKEKKEKKAEECYIIWKRTAWHDFIGWRKSSVLR